MKATTVIGAVLLAGGVGGLVVTNPPPTAYENYAIERASKYLNEGVCTDLPSNLSNLFQGQCSELVEASQPQLQTLIQNNTERLNLGVLSIYRTTLGIPGMQMMPTYELETVGIGGRFFTYSVNRQ